MRLKDRGGASGVGGALRVDGQRGGGLEVRVENVFQIDSFGDELQIDADGLALGTVRMMKE